MSNLFTSDLHFGHGGRAGNMGVINFCDRPFDHKDEMDHALIHNWNRVVSDSDIIYNLGDMFFCSRGRAIEITKQLNGQKFWIFGNHDKKTRKWKDLLEYFVWTGEYKGIRISDNEGESRDSSYNKIILMHYPIASWDGMHHGSWMLHGHSHATYHTKHNKIMDVGVDSTNELSPFTYEEVKKYMATRKFVPVDGHGLGKE